MSKIDKELPRDASNKNINLENTFRVLIWIADEYMSQVEIARSLWQFKRRIDRVLDQCARKDIQVYQQLLGVQLLIFTQLYIFGLTYGTNEHMIIVDDSSVEKPSSNNSCNRMSNNLLYREEKQTEFCGAPRQ